MTTIWTCITTAGAESSFLETVPKSSRTATTQRKTRTSICKPRKEKPHKLMVAEPSVKRHLALNRRSPAKSSRTVGSQKHHLHPHSRGFQQRRQQLQLLPTLASEPSRRAPFRIKSYHLQHHSEGTAVHLSDYGGFSANAQNPLRVTTIHHSDGFLQYQQPLGLHQWIPGRLNSIINLNGVA